MAVLSKRSVGIPIVLLHEGEGLILTVDTKSGITYRGYCVQTEDNMNMKLSSVVATEADGTQRSIEHVFIRGSQVNFIIFPDILALAPMFDRVRQRKAGDVVERGLGRARQAALDAKAARRGVGGMGNAGGMGGMGGAPRGGMPSYAAAGGGVGGAGAPRPAGMPAYGGGAPRGPAPAAPMYGGAMPARYAAAMSSAGAAPPRPTPVPVAAAPRPMGMAGVARPSAPVPSAGRGRGRGLTLPAWAQQG